MAESSSPDGRERVTRHPLIETQLTGESKKSSSDGGSSEDVSRSSPIKRRVSTPLRSSSPQQQQNNNYRHSMIVNLSNWISEQLNITSIDPYSIITSFTSQFRRRSDGPASYSHQASPSMCPLSQNIPPTSSGITRSKSESVSSSAPSSPLSVSSYPPLNVDEVSDIMIFDKPVAAFLNGTLGATAKSKDLIELTKFGVVEFENIEEGRGHSFKVRR